jgi:signal transduction histidine kinase
MVVVGGAYVAGLVLDARFREAGRLDYVHSGSTDVVFATGIVVSALVGSILLVRRPQHPVGWLFAAFAVATALDATLESYGVYGLYVRRGGAPGASAAAVVANSLFIVWITVLALVCSLTPDGAYLSSRWRRASQVLIASGALWFVLKLFSSGTLDKPFSSTDNPWAILPDLYPIRLLSAVVNNVLVVVAVVSIIVRFRRARGDARLQLRWMVVAAVPFPVLLALAFAAAVAGNDWLLSVAVAGFVVLLPVGAGLAVTRYHLFDVDRILSRAVTYLIVTGLLVASYVVVVLVVARALGEIARQSATATTLATLVAAGAARPVYVAVRDAIDRRFLRRRYDALHQVRTFVADPSPHVDIQQVLRQALEVPALRVAYWIDERSEWVSEDGRAVLIDDDAVIVTRGVRTIAAASDGGDDRRLLRIVLDEAAAELDNAGLRAAIATQLEEVRASRERIAGAHLEERRRIERDLHDGAQQRLLGSAAQMQAALLNGETERLRTALQSGVAEARATVVELRALANGLHPSVLADGGLAAALDDLSARFPVSIAVSTPGRRYPAIVEATMWFVACEGIANSIKHAQATHIDVRLDESGRELELIVVDDGRGGADPKGSGLRGLEDRVEAAGGRLVVTDNEPNGTRLEAVLPCES